MNFSEKKKNLITFWKMQWNKFSLKKWKDLLTSKQFYRVGRLSQREWLRWWESYGLHQDSGGTTWITFPGFSLQFNLEDNITFICILPEQSVLILSF